MSGVHTDRVQGRCFECPDDGLLVFVEDFGECDFIRELDGTLDLPIRKQKQECVGTRRNRLDAAPDELDVIFDPPSKRFGIPFALRLQGAFESLATEAEVDMPVAGRVFEERCHGAGPGELRMPCNRHYVTDWALFDYRHKKRTCNTFATSPLFSMTYKCGKEDSNLHGK